MSYINNIYFITEKKLNSESINKIFFIKKNMNFENINKNNKKDNKNKKKTLIIFNKKKNIWILILIGFGFFFILFLFISNILNKSKIKEKEIEIINIKIEKEAINLLKKNNIDLYLRIATDFHYKIYKIKQEYYDIFFEKNIQNEDFYKNILNIFNLNKEIKKIFLINNYNNYFLINENIYIIKDYDNKKDYTHTKINKNCEMFVVIINNFLPEYFE